MSRKKKTLEPTPPEPLPRIPPRPALYTAGEQDVSVNADGERILYRPLKRGDTVIAHFYEVEGEPTRCRNYAWSAARALNTCLSMEIAPGAMPPPNVLPPLWVEAQPHWEYTDLHTFYIMGTYYPRDPTWPCDGRRCVYGQTDNDLPTAWLFAASPDLKQALTHLMAAFQSLCPDAAQSPEMQEAQAALDYALSGWPETRRREPEETVPCP